MEVLPSLGRSSVDKAHQCSIEEWGVEGVRALLRALKIVVLTTAGAAVATTVSAVYATLQKQQH